MTSSLIRSGWLVHGLRATDQRDELTATLNLDSPAAGIAVRAGSADAALDHVLGLDLGAAVVPHDHWRRGRDVAAVYEPADARRLRATAMWRQWRADGTVAAWELIASAQTSLLESDPAVAVVTEALADEVLWPSASAAGVTWATAPHGGPQPADAASLLIRRRGRRSILIAAHPADAPGLQAAWTKGGVRIVCRLFTRQLEKGVLLRSRVLAASLPPDDELTQAARILAEFHAEPPPLTT